jgi:hypothetical protein
MEDSVKLKQNEDITVSQLSILNRVVFRKSNIELPIFRSTLPPAVDPARMAEIIEHGINLAESGKHQECINEIDEAVFNYFTKIASSLGKRLTDKAKLPEFIDFLREKGYISVDVWRMILDLMLVIDGLKMQDELLDQDVELLRELSNEWREQKTLYGDEGGNIPYFELTRIKEFNSNSLHVK